MLLATCGYVGFLPGAPGTYGAALGVPLAYGLAMLPASAHWAAVAVLFFVGFPICERAAQVLEKNDPSEVIWDELATVPITFLFVPPSSMKIAWVLVAGFALHRFFDIRKIAPAKKMESLHGGVGIMMDDLVAGVYSCACLHGLMFTVATMSG